MKRHPSLHALSQHHHFALIEALFIRRARQQPVGARAAALRRLAQKFVRFWDQTGRQHFREEEEILLPAYARHVSLQSDPDVVRMLVDHAEIRSHIELLRELLENKKPVEGVLGELGGRLQAHVRLEEDRVFPRIEKALPEAELEALGKRLSRLHKKGSSCEV